MAGVVADDEASSSCSSCSSCYLDAVPDECLLEIAFHLSCNSLVHLQTLATVNSRWNQICQSDALFRRYLSHKYGITDAAQQRLQTNINKNEIVAKRGVDKAKTPPVIGDLDDVFASLRALYEDASWKQKCVRLETNTAMFKGYAVEPDEYHPYTMQLLMGKTKNSNEYAGLLRWKSLGDGVTWMNGSDEADKSFVVDYEKYLEKLKYWSKAPYRERELFTIPKQISFPLYSMRRVAFVETQILIGKLVAVPNFYRGLQLGPILSGWFDVKQDFQIRGLWTVCMKERLLDCAPKAILSTMRREEQEEIANLWIPKPGATWQGLHWLTDTVGEDGDVATCLKVELEIDDDITNVSVSSVSSEDIIASFHGTIEYSLVDYRGVLSQQTLQQSQQQFSCFVLSPKLEPRTLVVPDSTTVGEVANAIQTAQPGFVALNADDALELNNYNYLNQNPNINDEHEQLELIEEAHGEEGHAYIPDNYYENYQDDDEEWEEARREYEKVDTTGGSDGKKTQLVIVAIQSPEGETRWLEGRLYGPNGPLILFGRKKDGEYVTVLESMHLIQK